MIYAYIIHIQKGRMIMARRSLIFVVVVILLIGILCNFVYSDEGSFTKDLAADKLEKAIHIYHAAAVMSHDYWFDDSTSKMPGNNNFLLLKDQYSFDNIKEWTNDTFVSPVADIVIKGLQKHYRVYDDKSYFQGGFAPQNYLLGYPSDAKSLKELITVISSNESEAIISVKTDYSSDIERVENRKPSVKVFFKKDKGIWKISGSDNSELVFFADRGLDISGELTKDIIVNAIVASVYDLYYYTRFGSTALSIQDIDNQDKIEVGGIHYSLLSGGYNLPKDWTDYANKFSDSSMIEKLLKFDKALLEKDGKIYCKTWARWYLGKIDSLGMAFHTIPNDIESRYTLNTISDTVSKVDYKFTDSLTVTLEFTKYSEGWKLSGGNFVDELDEATMEEIKELDLLASQYIPRTGDSSYKTFLLLLLIITMGMSVILNNRLKCKEDY